MPPKTVASKATRKPVVKSKAKRGGRVGVGGGGEIGRKGNSTTPLDFEEEDDDNTSNVGESSESEKVRELIALLNANMRRSLVFDETRGKLLYLDTPISSDPDHEALVIAESDGLPSIDGLDSVLFNVFAYDPDIDMYCVDERWDQDQGTLYCVYEIPETNRIIGKKDSFVSKKIVIDESITTFQYFIKDEPWQRNSGSTTSPRVPLAVSSVSTVPSSANAYSITDDGTHFLKVEIALYNNDSMNITLFDDITRVKVKCPRTTGRFIEVDDEDKIDLRKNIGYR